VPVRRAAADQCPLARYCSISGRVRPPGEVQLPTAQPLAGVGNTRLQSATPLAGNRTNEHILPFQYSIKPTTLMLLCPQYVPTPTLQPLSVPSIWIEVSLFKGQAELGEAMIAQLEPFQCSISVCDGTRSLQ